MPAAAVWPGRRRRPDVVRVPPGQRPWNPHGTRRRVDARRHAVPLRAPTARRLTRGDLPAEPAAPPPAVPRVPPIMFIILSNIRIRGIPTTGPGEGPSSGSAAHSPEGTGRHVRH